MSRRSWKKRSQQALLSYFWRSHCRRVFATCLDVQTKTIQVNYNVAMGTVSQQTAAVQAKSLICRVAAEGSGCVVSGGGGGPALISAPCGPRSPRQLFTESTEAFAERIFSPLSAEILMKLKWEWNFLSIPTRGMFSCDKPKSSEVF